MTSSKHVTAGLGKVAGLGAAYVTSGCYIVFTAAIIGPTAYFTHGGLNHWFGIDVPTWVLVFVILGLGADWVEPAARWIAEGISQPGVGEALAGIYADAVHDAELRDLI